MKKNIFLVVIFVLSNFFLLGKLQSQIINTDQTSTNRSSNLKINSDMPDILSQISQNNVMNITPGTPMEETIDAKSYIVGPNDLFVLGLYGYINQQMQIYVNPEGSIIIPTVGEIKLDGLTLEQAKEKVITAVKQRYYSSDVSFNLMTPRTFLINISGLVQAENKVC